MAIRHLKLKIASYQGNANQIHSETSSPLPLLYMDASHQELNRETYRPSELPTELTAPANTAYLLIEEHYTDKVLHKICQPEDKTFKTFYEIEHHICVPMETKVRWEE